MWMKVNSFYSKNLPKFYTKKVEVVEWRSISFPLIIQDKISGLPVLRHWSNLHTHSICPCSHNENTLNKDVKYSYCAFLFKNLIGKRDSSTTHTTEKEACSVRAKISHKTIQAAFLATEQIDCSCSLTIE